MDAYSETEALAFKTPSPPTEKGGVKEPTT